MRCEGAGPKVWEARPPGGVDERITGVGRGQGDRSPVGVRRVGGKVVTADGGGGGERVMFRLRE